MVDTLTTNIKLTNQTEGGNDNTWGTIADANFEEIDDKFGDVTSISTTGGTTTLTDAQEIVNAIHVSGTLVSNVTIVFSGRGGTWVVKNSTTGAFTVTCKVSGQTGVVITQGSTKIVYSTGTDIAETGSDDIVNDTTPQLGGDLDANGFSVQFDDATGIEDDSGNEQIRFQKTASAINQIDVTNAAVGGSPAIAATGDDTNIDLTLAGKGTGGLVGVFKASTGLGLYDSDSSHALQLKTSENLSATKQLDLKVNGADRTIDLSGNLTVSGAATLPAGTALVAANNLSDVSSAATAFAAIKQAATDGATGVVEIAVQAEMEAASDTGRAVVPGRQHFHPLMPKGWVLFDGNGAINSSTVAGNVLSVARDATGVYTVTFEPDFASTAYGVIGWARGEGGSQLDFGVSALSSDTKLAGSITVRVFNASTGNAADTTEVFLVFFGDLS